MEFGAYILDETMFQRARRQGNTSNLVTAKAKLRALLGDGATDAASSERPPDWVLEGAGEPPGIYTLEGCGYPESAPRTYRRPIVGGVAAAAALRCFGP